MDVSDDAAIGRAVGQFLGWQPASLGAPVSGAAAEGPAGAALTDPVALGNVAGLLVSAVNLVQLDVTMIR